MNGNFLTRMHSLQVPRTQPIVIQPHTILPQTEQGQFDECLEQYVVEMMDNDKYKLVEWRTERESFRHHRPTSFTYPHLEFETSERNQRFAVKCKWQDGNSRDKVWNSMEELENCIDYQQKQKTPVFILIATGENPLSPKEMFLAPLNLIKNNPELKAADLGAYRFSPGQQIMA